MILAFCAFCAFLFPWGLALFHANGSNKDTISDAKAAMPSLITIWLGLLAALLVVSYDGGLQLLSASGVLFIAALSMLLGVGSMLVLFADNSGMEKICSSACELTGLSKLVFWLGHRRHPRQEDIRDGKLTFVPLEALVLASRTAIFHLLLLTLVLFLFTLYKSGSVPAACELKSVQNVAVSQGKPLYELVCHK